MMTEQDGYFTGTLSSTKLPQGQEAEMTAPCPLNFFRDFFGLYKSIFTIDK
jgi:hypothetical protein